MKNLLHLPVARQLGLSEFILRLCSGSEAVERVADSDAEWHSVSLAEMHLAPDMVGAQRIRMAEVQRTVGRAGTIAPVFPQGTARMAEPEVPAFRTVEKHKVAVGMAGFGTAQLGVLNTLVGLVE